MASAAVAHEGNIARYLEKIRTFPVLSAEKELELSRRWRDYKEVAAVHMLVTSHLRLVVKIALNYRGYGLPISELISEGSVGMIRAAHRFDPDRGSHLAAYAVWWIRAEIQSYILRSWSLVRMGTSASQKKLFFNLRRLKGKMQVIDEGDLQREQVEEIARVLNVSVQDVVTMNYRLAAPECSLNAPVRHDSTDEWQDLLVDESSNQESDFAEREELSERKVLLAKALEELTEREQHILDMRRLRDDPVTLRDLAREYTVSQECIRQIEIRAIKKLRKSMRV